MLTQALAQAQGGCAAHRPTTILWPAAFLSAYHFRLTDILNKFELYWRSSNHQWCSIWMALTTIDPFDLFRGSSAAGQTGTSSQKSDPTPRTVNTWIQRATVIQQDNYRGLALQSPPAEGSADTRESHVNSVRRPTHPAASPVIVHDATGGPSPAPPYSFAPPVPEKAGTLQY